MKMELLLVTTALGSVCARISTLEINASSKIAQEPVSTTEFATIQTASVYVLVVSVELIVKILTVKLDVEMVSAIQPSVNANVMMDLRKKELTKLVTVRQVSAHH